MEGEGERGRDRQNKTKNNSVYIYTYTYTYIYIYIYILFMALRTYLQALYVLPFRGFFLAGEGRLLESDIALHVEAELALTPNP